MSTVCTYYEPVAGMAYPRKLIDLWAVSWRDHGWETLILSEADAKDHPGYEYFSERIRAFPSVNPSGYERACYMRHLAMASTANCHSGYLTDYDVINRGYVLEDGFYPVSDFSRGKPTILEPTRVPCAVLADPAGWEELCDIICEYTPKPGETHISDMTILRQSPVDTSASCVEHLCSGRPIRDDLGDGWKTAPLVHFSNFSFSKLGWRGDKADLIQRVLATLPPLQ